MDLKGDAYDDFPDKNESYLNSVVHLSEKIGSLPRDRFNQVYEGSKLLIEPREVDGLQ